MPFWPDTIWGVAYVSALILVTAYVFKGRDDGAKLVVCILIANWLAMRIIDAIDHTNFALWIASDVITIMALISCRKGLATVCGALYFVTLLLDSIAYAENWGFEGPAAVAEAIGYVSMILAAGAANDFGKLLYGAGGRLLAAGGDRLGMRRTDCRED